MQGTAFINTESRYSQRFIPAYAGNGDHWIEAKESYSVHPRVCRERSAHLSSRALYRGSSPRMQGTADRIVFLCYAGRFIPAYAGNGNRLSAPQSRQSVHPRVCRERLRILGPLRRADGSSPRMQGTGEIPLSPVPEYRFIPAYAGNGRSMLLTNRPWAVHPRVCRERDVCKQWTYFIDGSSPRMQGTDHWRRLFGPLCRFIPAYAGNGRSDRPKL